MSELIGWLLLIAVVLGAGALAVSQAEGVIDDLRGNITDYEDGDTGSEVSDD
jgi:hypothetical protein